MTVSVKGWLSDCGPVMDWWTGVPRPQTVTDEIGSIFTHKITAKMNEWIWHQDVWTRIDPYWYHFISVSITTLNLLLNYIDIACVCVCLCVCLCDHLLTRCCFWSSAAEHWPQLPAARAVGRAGRPDSPPLCPPAAAAAAAAGGPPRPSRQTARLKWSRERMQSSGGIKQHREQDVKSLTGQQQQCAVLL